MHRFFIDSEALQSDQIVFPRETAHQISRVLRLRPGDEVKVLLGDGWEILARLEEVAERSTTAKVIERIHNSGEPRVRLTLILALTQREKFEWILQKCTEIGAAAFLPVITSHSLVQDTRVVIEKFPRWEKILKEAAEQSGRGVIPQLNPPLSLGEALISASQTHTLCLVAWEGEHATGVKQALEKPGIESVAVLVGPEGGLSLEEVELAVKHGYKTVSLGKRVLRMETAALVAATLVFHEIESLS